MYSHTLGTFKSICLLKKLKKLMHAVSTRHYRTKILIENVYLLMKSGKMLENNKLSFAFRNHNFVFKTSTTRRG